MDTLSDIDNLIYEISVGLIGRYYKGRAKQLAKMPKQHQKEVMMHAVSHAKNVKKNTKSISSQVLSLATSGYGEDIPGIVKSAKKFKTLKTLKNFGELTWNMIPSHPLVTTGISFSKDVASSTGKIARRYRPYSSKK